MTLLGTINVGQADFGLLNSTVMGVCSTPAGSEVKVCTFADNFELKAGTVVTIKFTYANTYGDGSTTYPKLSVNGVTGAIRNVTGEYASNGCWNNQALVPLLFDGTDFTLLINNVTDEVSDDNKYSVSSKGVAAVLATESGTLTATDETIEYMRWGKAVIIEGKYSGQLSDSNMHRPMTILLPQRLHPAVAFRAALIDNTSDTVCGQCVVNKTGDMVMWLSHLLTGTFTNLVFTASYLVN